MTERDLALCVAKAQAPAFVDEFDGVTLGGSTIAEKYNKKWSKAGYDVTEAAEAIRHWVVSAGYDNDGKFQVIMSNFRM